MGTQVNLKRSSEIEAMYERSNVNVKVDYDVLTCDLSYFNNPYFVWILRTVLHFSKSRGQASFRKGKNVKRFP